MERIVVLRPNGHNAINSYKSKSGSSIVCEVLLYLMSSSPIWRGNHEAKHFGLRMVPNLGASDWRSRHPRHPDVEATDLQRKTHRICVCRRHLGRGPRWKESSPTHE